MLCITEGEQALQQGEFGEAVRILTEALQFAPTDEHLRELKVRAVQERDRLRQVREAISGGQRALRSGEYEIAEKQFDRALQLEPANPQATSLLAQARGERQARAKGETLVSGLKQAEGLIAAKKFDEAQRQLDELRKDFPEAKPLQALFETLKQKKTEAGVIPSALPRSTVLPPPANDYTKSMELAEELRRNLQNLKSSPRARPNLRAQSTMASGPRPATPPNAPPNSSAPPVGDGSNVTLVRGAVPANSATPAKPLETNATVASTPKLMSSATGQKAPPPQSEKPETKPDED